MRVLVINGPNINMLGIREPGIYGVQTYADLKKYICLEAEKLEIDVDIYQSNHEGDLIDKIQEALNRYDGIVINAGAYTHTSVAILDALKSVGLPTAEVHLTDINEREPFRKFSYVSLYAQKKICGKGFEGYAEGLAWLKDNS